MYINITEMKDTVICGDGCCHGDGLFIDFENGEDAFYMTSDKDEIQRLINMFRDLYPNSVIKCDTRLGKKTYNE